MSHPRLAAAGAVVVALCSALFSAAAGAQSVGYSGRMGDKALLLIDGSPRTLAVGATAQGVKLVALQPDAAQVEVGGKRHWVNLGGMQANLGGAASAGSGSQIVLQAGPGGHFVTSGSVNGHSTRFLVDTGASVVSIGQKEADNLGLKYRDGDRGMASTANGNVPVYRVMLTSVKVGDVQVYNVEALVMPASMEHILLGNSFLSRFQMKRENDRLTLDKRP
jgi:aspartyl protease family protein